DPGIQVLQLAERRVDGEHDTFALVVRERRSFSFGAGHAVSRYRRESACATLPQHVFQADIVGETWPVGRRPRRVVLHAHTDVQRATVAYACERTLQDHPEGG